MLNYKENEVKVLDIDVNNIITKLEMVGAKLVYNDIRCISSYDTVNLDLRNRDILLRMTKEQNIKITIHKNNSSLDRDIIKIHPLENDKVCNDFLNSLGLYRQTEVKARRISFELDCVDFDIDIFPHIPPFMEIDLGNGYNIERIKKELEIENNQIVRCGTEEIFKMYNFNYYDIFKFRI